MDRREVASAVLVVLVIGLLIGVAQAEMKVATFNVGGMVCQA